jgi:hypothetical protein
MLTRRAVILAKIENGIIVITSGVNDKLDFKEDGGSELHATLTAGSYSPAALAAEVNAQLVVAGDDSTICAYDASTKKFTISRTGTSLSLLWLTGVNTAISCGIALGYAVSADDTASLSYLADNQVGYGVDSVPTVGSNAILAYSPKITPVPEKITRDPALSTLSKLNPLVGKRYVDFTFSTDLRGSGTAILPPRWSDLLESAGFLETIGVSDVTYTPRSSLLKSCSIYAYFDGLLHKILGAVVTNLEIVLPAGGLGKLNWTLRGLYAEPTDVGVPSGCVYDSPVPPIVESAAFTLDGVTDYVINQLSIVIANDVALRGDVISAAGVKGFAITGRTVTGSMDPEAMTKATVNIWDIWTLNTTKALSIVIGTGTGRKWTITAASVSLDNIDSGDREGIRTFEIPITLGGSTEISLKQSS